MDKSDNKNLHTTPEETGHKKEEKSYDFSGESVFLMTFLGGVAVAFCYIVYLLIF